MLSSGRLPGAAAPGVPGARGGAAGRHPAAPLPLRTAPPRGPLCALLPFHVPRAAPLGPTLVLGATGNPRRNQGHVQLSVLHRVEPVQRPAPVRPWGGRGLPPRPRGQLARPRETRTEPSTAGPEQPAGHVRPPQSPPRVCRGQACAGKDESSGAHATPRTHQGAIGELGSPRLTTGHDILPAVGEPQRHHGKASVKGSRCARSGRACSGHPGHGTARPTEFREARGLAWGAHRGGFSAPRPLRPVTHRTPTSCFLRRSRSTMKELKGDDNGSASRRERGGPPTHGWDSLAGRPCAGGEVGPSTTSLSRHMDHPGVVPYVRLCAPGRGHSQHSACPPGKGGQQGAPFQRAACTPPAPGPHHPSRQLLWWLSPASLCWLQEAHLTRKDAGTHPAAGRATARARGAGAEPLLRSRCTEGCAARPGAPPLGPRWPRTAPRHLPCAPAVAALTCSLHQEA